jgi:branched-chain amino acid transport system substrate-binding protein
MKERNGGTVPKHHKGANQHRSLRLVAGFAVVATLAAACGSNNKTAAKASGSASTSPPKATLKIGDLESLTGAGASVGVPQANAIKLAVKEINDAGGVKVGATTYSISLDTLDDKSDPTAGVTAVQRMLTDNVKYMVGSLSSAVTGAYIPVVKDNPNFVSIVVGAALEGITSNPPIYRPRITLSQYTNAVVSYLKAKGTVKKLAILTDQQHSGFVQQTPALKAGLVAAGIDVVDTESYKFGDTNFSAQIAAMLRKSPDALHVRGYPADVTRVIKQAREAGFTGPIYLTSGVTMKEVTNAQSAAQMNNTFDLFAPLTSDLIEANINADKAKKFEDAYRAAYGSPTGATSASAYDGVYILARALAKAGSVDDVAAVRKALDSLTVSDVAQLVEPIKEQSGGLIFKDRQSYFKVVVRQWQNGAFHPGEFV